MFDLFGWLRQRVKAAVLAGVGDAVSEISEGNSSSEAASIEGLKLQLTSTPADSQESTTKKTAGKKAG